MQINRICEAKAGLKPSYRLSPRFPRALGSISAELTMPCVYIWQVTCANRGKRPYSWVKRG